MAIVAILSVLVAACGGGSDGGNGAATGALRTDVDQADRNAEFRYALAYSVGSFDPHKSPVATSDAIFMAPVYDRIVTLTRDEDGKVQIGPQRATSWTIAPDQKSVSFVLRSDVTFQDGTPFNGAAVKANIDRAKAPGSTIASVLSMVESVDVTDDTHVTFRLTTHSANDDLALLRNPVRFKNTTLERYDAPPVLGQHTDDVLSSWLDLGDGEIEDLRQGGAV